MKPSYYRSPVNPGETSDKIVSNLSYPKASAIFVRTGYLRKFPLTNLWLGREIPTASLSFDTTLFVDS